MEMEKKKAIIRIEATEEGIRVDAEGVTARAISGLLWALADPLEEAWKGPSEETAEETVNE